MTLLDSIIRAMAAADAGEVSFSPTVPIILNSDDIFPTLKPESESPTSLPILRVSGWSISATDSNIIKLTSKFSKTLKKKLKKSLDRAEFLKLLNAFLQSIGDNLGLGFNPEAYSHLSFDFSRFAIEKVGFFIGQEVAGLIIDACVVLELFELVETLIVHGLVGHLYATNLVEKLLEHNQARLLCLSVKHISDLRPSELLVILRFFLSPSDNNSYDSFLGVKKEWERQALLAIEKATNKAVPQKAATLAREASILLMLAHDGFSPAELCLHYVFGSSEMDRLVLSSVISKLSGREILGLIRYFGKWLKKYERFPEAVPCPQAKSLLSLSACEDIPSFDSVVRALGLILDEHFSYLVLNSEFHDEMRAMQKVVSDLAS
ncbi:uncharacterized protein LOC110102655 [Dendrobium catenatum]|uniref:Uncharacterized protein n=1 Tax=Dendrobium catenatum TaxID=906689 RepID=A0A2I0VLK5_9ASPA|nr:uncharacterized protein LOC110102655 [Dendrobium catenatum]XP_028556726.1 uncharacterized protein LOC110102655 [Dendrobium catenatum]PKU64296.1 hypothetical protein MA16_Dca005219 [Dendrobium catenatum]